MIAFDLDGTLVNTVPDLSYSIDAMLNKLSLPAAGETKVRSWVGHGIERLVTQALTNQMDKSPDKALIAKALTIFIQEYKNNTCRQSQLYEGAVESLNYLAEKQLKLACITNKLSQFTDIVLKTLGIYNKFGIIVSGDTLAKRKPDPLPLLHVADYFNIRPEQALMVGDSLNDINAAHTAGFQMICVSYGYNLNQNIQSVRPDRTIGSLIELTNIF